MFYESPHRILESISDMDEVFGSEREATVARELTKTFETIKQDTLSGLKAWMESDTDQTRGEFVVIVSGWQEPTNEELDDETIRILKTLLNELPVKQASKLAAEITGEKKNRLYQYALEHLK